jgi:hypothetical protein
MVQRSLVAAVVAVEDHAVRRNADGEAWIFSVPPVLGASGAKGLVVARARVPKDDAGVSE